MSGAVTSKETCGLVMPISTIDGLPEAHWAEVLSILSEAIEDAGFVPNLVSNADDVGIIQKRIIQNLYDNPIIVCDVSGKNPNVMFELGVRLAFDKPTIIVKDDKTAYSFDTSPIEHLTYPRDLRYVQIGEFKARLAEKIKGTYEKASSDRNYTTFLKNFGEFTVAKLDKKEITGQEFILEELRSLRSAIQRLDRLDARLIRTPSQDRLTASHYGHTLEYTFPALTDEQRDAVDTLIIRAAFARSTEWTDVDGRSHVKIGFAQQAAPTNLDFVRRQLDNFVDRRLKSE